MVFHQPIRKNMFINLDHETPSKSGWKFQTYLIYLRCHHLAILLISMVNWCKLVGQIHQSHGSVLVPKNWNKSWFLTTVQLLSHKMSSCKFHPQIWCPGTRPENRCPLPAVQQDDHIHPRAMARATTCGSWHYLKHHYLFLPYPPKKEQMSPEK